MPPGLPATVLIALATYLFVVGAIRFESGVLGGVHGVDGVYVLVYLWVGRGIGGMSVLICLGIWVAVVCHDEGWSRWEFDLGDIVVHWLTWVPDAVRSALTSIVTYYLFGKCMIRV